jgi:hypothetical protein
MNDIADNWSVQVAGMAAIAAAGTAVCWAAAQNETVALLWGQAARAPGWHQLVRRMQ